MKFKIVHNLNRNRFDCQITIYWPNPEEKPKTLLKWAYSFIKRRKNRYQFIWLNVDKGKIRLDELNGSQSS